MLDFQAVREKRLSMSELVADLRTDDLRELTNEMVDLMLTKIRSATDADVVFVPEDPDADDTFAANEADRDLAWTLGHVIVHTTASAEESAFLAAEMARGVEPHGRSRAEVPWQSVTSIAQCRERLEESRRMRLASLDMWPAKPDLALCYRPWPSAPEINAVGRFVLGLSHDASHLNQIDNIVAQAKAART